MPTEDRRISAEFLGRHPWLWFVVVYCVCFTAIASAAMVLSSRGGAGPNPHLLAFALALPFWLASCAWARRTAGHRD